jgi:anaerobic selenocysteine-containing dehydrogenase
MNGETAFKDQVNLSPSIRIADFHRSQAKSTRLLGARSALISGSFDSTAFTWNGRKQRIFKTKSGKAKLSVCPIPKHHLKLDEFLLTTIRSHDQFNSTIYGLNDRYRGVFDGRRVLFLNPLDMEARNLRAGQIVNIYNHFGGEIRKAPHFAIVPRRDEFTGARNRN